MAKVFIAPNEPERELMELSHLRETIKIFLAGGISGCKDWQSEVIEILNSAPEIANDDDIWIFSPRRDVANDLIDPKEQIDWEFKWLRHVDIVSFFFDGSESVQPITLYELGQNLQYQLGDEFGCLAVSVEKDYKRAIDIQYQMENILSETNGVTNVLELNATPRSHAEFIRRKIMVHKFIKHYNIDYPA